MGMERSVVRRRKRRVAAQTQARNRLVKDKERARRDARMVETIKRGVPPYHPAVASWLSRKLNKKAKSITPEDVRTLLR